MADKSKLSIGVPHPPKQGGHGKAPVQPANIQSKKGDVAPGKSEIKFSKQPSGVASSGTVGKPGRGVK